MTKLTPIEELAKQCSAEFIPAYSETTANKDTISFNIKQLEALRQAIISDFVNSREPVGYLCQKQPIDGWATLYAVKQDEVSINPNGHFNTPLFDLPKWKTK